MALHLTQYRAGFAPGITEITRFDEAEEGTGIGLAVHRLAAGESFEETAAVETAWLLMSGDVTVQVDGDSVDFQRRSLFDESPSCVHVAAGTTVRATCHDAVEFTVYRTANRRPFAARIFRPEDVPNEHRGKGQMGETCTRFVRTIFDGSTSDEATDLVLGEVITMPGRWSSYPPHSHPQPEIYHYRFTEPQGFGHGELGETVLRVRAFDTVKIFGGYDHAQCAAPGYGMYYAWVIRHLPGNRYTVPDFNEEHRWTMQEGAKFWQPAGLDT
jgi:5-deoxy-glucuronate isomerase